MHHNLVNLNHKIQMLNEQREGKDAMWFGYIKEQKFERRKNLVFHGLDFKLKNYKEEPKKVGET